MSKPHDPHGQSGAAPSRNPFVRFQKGFERRFDQFRESYGQLLEYVIDRRSTFVKISLAVALASLCLFFFLGRDYFPEIPSGVIQMHMRAPLGTRIEVSGRLATLVSNSIEELLPGQVENIVSNCGLPVGPHNLAFIPTPTIGSQDCDLTILLENEKSPVWDYRRTLRKGLRERYPGTEFTFQPSDLTAKILNFGAPAPIDVQVNGPDIYANYEYARKLVGKFREIPGAVDVVIQQTMRTPTLMVEGNRTFGLGVNRTLKDMADNLLMTTAGSQQVDQIYWLDPFIFITALPGALAGIAWALFLTHTRLSEPALTGAIMTMGTATANSILVVSYARERLQEHGNALLAAIEAGKTRLRPVLMTALAMIIGMVPMATGSSTNAPLGRAVIGGLFVATLFTLLFVPCVYAMIYNRRMPHQKERAT